MKIYEIVIQEGKMSYEQSHHVIATDFDDAYKQALKRLATARKNTEDARIQSITEEFELEVIK